MKTAGTNFDFLKRIDEFAMFADTAIEAERRGVPAELRRIRNEVQKPPKLSCRGRGGR